MRVTLKTTLGRSVAGTVLDTLRGGAVCFVQWDNGACQWHDTDTLQPA